MPVPAARSATRPPSRIGDERHLRRIRCQAAISGYPVAMARKQPKRNFGTRLRSAVTGRFVKSGQAKRSPRTTVTERIPIGRRGKGKKR